MDIIYMRPIFTGAIYHCFEINIFPFKQMPTSQLRHPFESGTLSEKSLIQQYLLGA